MPERSPLRRFLIDLRGRHVFRVAAIYLVVAWLMIEVAATVFPMMGLPDWAPALVFALFAIGLPVALAIAWVYDMTPQGVVRASPRIDGQATTPAPAPARSDVTPAPAPAPAPAPVNADSHARRDTSVATAPVRSLAVLPFADLSRERDQEYLGDGIAEEILNVLAQVAELRVAARTSAFAFKGRNIDVRDIGRQLGVDAVLEGSVRTAGERLRVTAQLIGVHDGYHIWSRRFDRDLSDVFAVQDEIAAEIAAALEVAKPAVDVSARSATEHLGAYEAYLKGRQFFHRKTGRSLRIAEQLFKEAIAIDPGYAPAHAGLADTCSMLYMFWAPTEHNRRCADESSQRALERGPHVAEAHVSRGLALTLQKRYDEAASEFDAAIAINPRLYDAWYFFARSAYAAGDMTAAAERFERAGEIQPESFDNWGLLANAYTSLGRIEDARAATGRAIEAAEATLRLSPDDVRALYFGSGALVLIGERERGLEWAERAASMDPDDPGVHYNLACTYSLAGEVERAMKHLERALELGYGSVEWLEHDSDLAAVREHPRYPALVEKMRRLQTASA
ncbi:MAG TPA: tetratricopeptide repeat protein [Longimicrobiales bacterium]|nr:tetratricopeptide repeat protein [Longimicrobiales bacterium]